MSHKKIFGNMMDSLVSSYPPATVITVTIPTGSPYSEPIDFPHGTYLGVVLDQDEWTASDLVIQVSANRRDWVTATDATGAVVKMTSISSGVRWMRSFPTYPIIAPFPYIRLATVNTSTGVPVNQTGNREIHVCIK